MTTSRSPRKTRYDEAALPVRTAIYTRISLDSSGEGPGIQRQLDECLALADRLGWQVVARLSDNDVSAFNGKRRDGFEDLLDGLKNKRFGAVIVWHVDRLYRTLKDLARLLEVASGVQIRTVNGGDFDLSTATGRMVATILGSVAVQESEHKGERQRAANAQKATAGTWQTAGTVRLHHGRRPGGAGALRAARGRDRRAGGSLGPVDREAMERRGADRHAPAAVELPRRAPNVDQSALRCAEGPPGHGRRPRRAISDRRRHPPRAGGLSVRSGADQVHQLGAQVHRLRPLPSAGSAAARLEGRPARWA